jgi:hypothetical protein
MRGALSHNHINALTPLARMSQKRPILNVDDRWLWLIVDFDCSAILRLFDTEHGSQIVGILVLLLLQLCKIVASSC